MSKLKERAVFHGVIWEELSERGRLRNGNIHRLCEDMREPKKALLCSGWYLISLNASFRERASNLHLRSMPLPSRKVFLSIFSPFLLPNQAASQIFKRKACRQPPKDFGRYLLLISGKFGRAFWVQCFKKGKNLIKLVFWCKVTQILILKGRNIRLTAFSMEFIPTLLSLYLNYAKENHCVLLWVYSMRFFVVFLKEAQRNVTI